MTLIYDLHMRKTKIIQKRTVCEFELSVFHAILHLNSGLPPFIMSALHDGYFQRLMQKLSVHLLSKEEVHLKTDTGLQNKFK